MTVLFLSIKPGFLLDKKIGVNQPKRIENAKILIANTAMDTDKIKVRIKSISAESTSKFSVNVFTPILIFLNLEFIIDKIVLTWLSKIDHVLHTHILMLSLPSKRYLVLEFGLNLLQR